MKRRGVFVAGTDTDCGKTCVSAGLLRALVRRGLNVAPWKPYASGVDPERLTDGEDVDLLLRAAGWPPERLHDVSPVRFADALAPSVAGRRAGRSIDPAAVVDACPVADWVVVEGCGGALVPLIPDDPRYDVRELCWDLQLPVLVVARPGLGTINHTALTVDALRNAGLDVLGVVISGFDEATAGLAERTNAEEIERTAQMRVLGAVARVSRPADVDALADALESAIDVDALVAEIERRVDPATAQALRDDDRSTVWHPFTQMAVYAAEQPIVIDRARGAWLYDVDGNRYLDAISSLWVTTHGHREPALDAAVRAQLGKVAHSTLLGLGNAASVECARRLVEVAPAGLNHVFYSDNGSTAVEVALKMAFQGAAQRGEPQRQRFVHFDGSYHGDTLGAVSVGGIPIFHEVFGPLLFHSDKLPAPRMAPSLLAPRDETDLSRSLEALEAFLAQHPDDVAGVVVEPGMQGACGMRPQPTGWLTEVARLTRAAGAALICDEVATGFGRTGRMFAVEHEGVVPDLLCVAKGLTGGYLPLAATLATDAIHDAFLGGPTAGRTFFHGHTYTGNPLACAAAVANLDLMRERGTVTEAARKGDRLGELLRTHLAGHPHVGDLRQRGMMAGIELVAARAPWTPFPVETQAANRVCAEAARRGLRIRPLGDVLVLMPPLGIDDALLDEIVVRLRDVLHATFPTRATPSGEDS